MSGPVKHENPSWLSNTKTKPTVSSGSTSLQFIILTILEPELLNL
jgi:hypothetical protein